MTTAALPTNARGGFAPDAPATPAPPGQPVPSLRGRAIRGAVWTLGGHGATQVIRLGSNLVLTRLLFPKAFGLMALVAVFSQGLQMFSDIGIGPSIIQGKHGDDRNFVNTAWTVQVLRGILLWLACVVIAFPVSMAYDPQLRWLLPVAGFSAVIGGFTSTRWYTLNRQLILGRETVLDLAAQLVFVGVTVTYAWIWPSVWALVAGGLASALTKTALSFLALPGEPNEFCWDREALSNLVRFGRWIFIGTAFTFLAGQGDKLILGLFVPAAALGVYGVAANLAAMLTTVLLMLSEKVLFPVYVHLLKDRQVSSQHQIRKVRTALLATALPVTCGLVVFAEPLIRLMYDERYAGAGWILQMLGVSAIVQIMAITLSPVVLAAGDSFRHMVVMGLRSATLLGAMLLGGWINGETGMIVGIVVASVLHYPVVVWSIRPYGVWKPGLDLTAFVGSAIAIGAGLTATRVWTH